MKRPLSALAALIQRGFRRQAALLLVAAITSTVAVTAGVTLVLATRIVTSNEIEQGLQTTTSFAHGSTLALLVGSPQNGKEAADRALASPDVEFVGMYDNTGKVIREGGVDPKSWHPQQSMISEYKKAIVAYENDDHWHFIAPVFTSTTTTPDSPFTVSPSRDEFLGYVYVVRSKAPVKRLGSYLVSAIVVLAIAAVLMALAVFIPLMNRLLRPILDLSETLEQATTNPSLIRVTERGPPEMVKMARAFNNMMGLLEEHEQRLRENSKLLESQVQLRTEELRQAHDLAISANRNKSAFLALVAHELRTPLQSIVGYTQLAVKNVRPLGQESILRDLSIVLQTSIQLRTIIDNVLDLSKIEEGRMSVTLRTVDVKKVGNEVAEILAPLAQHANNKLDVSIEGTPQVINTDRDKLRQIILNLLSNACKFTRNGNIRMAITCDRDQTVISVRDTGRGIAKTDQQSIFEAFHQAGTEGNHPGGTGLGLAIVSRFAKLLDGTVEVESELNKGAAFIVRLPIKQINRGANT
ncbi:MAG: hypothetical protein HY308_14460 [Gammaproteobacteria bacterium]|nr:hypothetical protein [Gammaproteobacteria bacterium]